MEDALWSFIRYLDTTQGRRLVSALMMGIVGSLALSDVVLMLVSGRGLTDYLELTSRLMHVAVLSICALGGGIGARWTYSNIHRHNADGEDKPTSPKS